MKKLTKNTISLILAAIMLSSAFVSCSESPQDKTESKTAESQNISAEESETEKTEEGEKLDVPFTDYEGYTFNALTGDNVTYNWRELTVEEITGEPINDAFYNRNLWVEDKLNIKNHIRSQLRQAETQARLKFRKCRRRCL